MKVSLAQLNPVVGDVRGNLALVEKAMAQAKAAGSDLLLCPELTLTGYPPRDLLDYRELVDANLQALHRLASHADGLTVVVGFIERNQGAGHPFFNAAAVLSGDKIQKVYRKWLLPYYDVFDEPRHFEPGRDTCVVQIAGKKVAVTICEDLWNFAGFIDKQYEAELQEELKALKPDVVVNLSASPFHVGKPERRAELFCTAARELNCVVVACNQIGAIDEVIFDGGSVVATPTAGTHFPVFEEGVYTVDLAAPLPAKAAWPQSAPEWHAGALALGLRDYLKKTGQSRVVLGLSGGIDSSVVAALAARALGPQNVLGVAMPSRYSAPESEADARELAKNLGIAYKVASIEPMFAAFQTTWTDTMKRTPTSLTLENVQPRLRMAILMAFANEENRLLLNTSNKSELACGYSTLYGDASGALSPLGDLVKGEVYALARYYGDVIPRRCLERPPTAELRPNQTDQDTLPDYPTLDAMVKAVVERGLGRAELLQLHFDPIKVDTFLRLHTVSEHKRRQFPPVLRVSPRAFGMGRRVPVASAKPWQ